MDDFPCIQLSPLQKHKTQSKLFYQFYREKKTIYLKLLCGARGGFDRPVESRPRPMSSSRSETPRHILSDDLFCKLMPGLGSPIK